MTNHEKYIKNASLDELAEFLLSLTLLLNPSDCTGCPAHRLCETRGNEYDSCADSVKAWLTDGGFDDIRAMSIDELATFLGGIGHHIFDESNCQDCPANKVCRERNAENCEQAFRFWLEAEADEDDVVEEHQTNVTIKESRQLHKLVSYYTRGIEELLLNMIERYERGEQPDPGNEMLGADIIRCYEKGCGCVYCPKSAVPDRSPEKDICTPADCAHGLLEYLRRIED